MPNTIRVALVGQPNCGKSTFFNQIVGYRANTSNFPGTTVEFMRAKATYGELTYEFIDLPGIYSLLGEEPAEKVTLNFLLNEKVDVILNIIDSSVLSRSLELTLELTSLGIPMIVVMNMMDEAEKKGLKVDIELLSSTLGVDIVETVAVQGKGIDKVIKYIPAAKIPRNLLEDTLKKLELEYLKEIETTLKEKFVHLRSSPILAILLLADIQGQYGILTEEDKNLLKTSYKDKMDIDNVWLFFHQEKHKIAMEIFEKVARLVHKNKRRSLDSYLDAFFLHPFFGPISALVILILIFFLTQKFGGYISELFAKPFEIIQSNLPVKEGWFYTILKSIVDGINSGIGIVFPYFIPFILFISFLEDIGYLSRFAFVLDHFLHRIGLHGKSAVPLILGYGCNVPAIFSTRIIESERERLNTAFLVPFIPCSARLSIIFALSTLFLGSSFALVLFIGNIIIIAVIGKILSKAFRSEVTDFILEITPYRLPSIKSLLSKVWFKLKDFIFFAWPLIIGGSIVLSILEITNLSSLINKAFSPFVHGILRLPDELGIVLIFGILRKELALIMASEALNVPVKMLNSALSNGQLASFIVFVTFYTPCLSTVLALWKETNIKWTIFQILVSLIVATLLALLTGLAFVF
ncbi:MAG: ferrous iron transport protein B [candidate division WOR-3 bacterium]